VVPARPRGSARRRAGRWSPLDPVCTPPRPRIELGHQLYPVLERCRKPEILWSELASGNYDWLGVRCDAVPGGLVLTLGVE
jgi:hypothetical protein